MKKIYTRYELTNEQYHASQGISNSGLSLIEKSPAHFKRKTFKTTASLKKGRAFHTYILENDIFYDEYAISSAKNRRGNAYKDEVKEFELAGFDKDCVLLEHELEKIKPARNEYMKNTLFNELITDKNAEFEKSFFAYDDGFGELLKCRFDCVIQRESGDIGLDLKTTRSSLYRSFSRSIYDYNYHQQEQFYKHVYELATGRKMSEFYFFAVETEAPYANKIYELCPLSREIGEKKWRDNLAAYKAAKELDTWNIPSSDLEIISLPEFALSDYENEIINGLTV